MVTYPRQGAVVVVAAASAPHRGVSVEAFGGTARAEDLRSGDARDVFLNARSDLVARTRSTQSATVVRRRSFVRSH